MYTLNNLENKEKFKFFSPKHFSLKIFKRTEDRYAGQGSSQLLTLSHKMYSELLGEVKAENSQLYNSHCT